MAVSPKDILDQAKIGQSRSSVLNPLQWTLAILIAGIVSLLMAHGPNWLTIVLAALLSTTCAVFLCAFLYFMVKDPDALRSEPFYLTKFAMDQRLITPALETALTRLEHEVSGGRGVEIKEARELKTRRRAKAAANAESIPQGQTS